MVRCKVNDLHTLRRDKIHALMLEALRHSMSSSVQSRSRVAIIRRGWVGVEDKVQSPVHCLLRTQCRGGSI